MDQILYSPTLLGLLVLSLAVYFGNQRYKPKYDAKEPPLIPQTLPYIGHLIGLWIEGFGYYKKLRAMHQLPPIYTLQLLNVKSYVINDLDSVVAVQRSSKNLLLSPILAGVVPRLFDLDEDVTSLTLKHLQDANGEWAAHTHLMNMATYVQLAPGPQLDSVVRKMQRGLKPVMDQLQEQTRGEEDVFVELYGWIKRVFGLAITEAIYGGENPFKLHPELLDALWVVNDYSTLLLINILPWLTAREAYQARQQLFDGMNEYFASDWRNDASEFIKARYDAFEKRNFSVDAIARYEVGNLAGIMINAVAPAFWVLNYIYLDSELLEALRVEIAASMSTSTDDQTGTRTHHLDVKKIQDKCGLLMRTYQEVLRLQTDNLSVRWVVKDTMINDKYLLKKNSLVQIPEAIFHQDPAVWGPDVKEFNPGRFLKGAAKHHPGAFRVFGDGAALCPGRHFAAAEVISLVVMFVMRFDPAPINYGWRKPLPEKSSPINPIPPASSDIKVRVKTREGFEKDEWVFEN